MFDREKINYLLIRLALCTVLYPSDAIYRYFGIFCTLFRASKSADASEEGRDYIRAEQSGRDRGECWQYYSKCPRSLFSQQDNNNLYM